MISTYGWFIMDFIKKSTSNEVLFSCCKLQKMYFVILLMDLNPYKLYFLLKDKL